MLRYFIDTITDPHSLWRHMIYPRSAKVRVPPKHRTKMFHRASRLFDCAFVWLSDSWFDLSIRFALTECGHHSGVVMNSGGKPVYKSVAPSACRCFGLPSVCTICLSR